MSDKLILIEKQSRLEKRRVKTTLGVALILCSGSTGLVYFLLGSLVVFSPLISLLIGALTGFGFNYYYNRKDRKDNDDV